MIKRIINISIWVLSVIALLTIEVYAIRQYRNTTCSQLVIELNNNNNYPLLTSTMELRTELLQNHLPIEGQKIKSLDLKQIEKNIDQIAYLEQSDSYLSINGNLDVKASPRKAIIRIYNSAGQHFYLGTDTIVMPLSSKHTIRLLLASGTIHKINNDYFNQNRNDTLSLPDIYKKIYILAVKIQEDEFLNALIDQIYVKPDQEFEVIPKAGVSYIELGNINNIDDKLKRLKNFYIKGKEKVNWTIYKSINLKYDNQVVCTKK
ncbi:MAG: hypothetical protein PF484_03465 [Bacteroidales bacterium]|jgi:cell division protein FtsQ|nr:hypothetical protein [Bacteroidales bacterium]